MAIPAENSVVRHLTDRQGLPDLLQKMLLSLINIGGRHCQNQRLLFGQNESLDDVELGIGQLQGVGQIVADLTGLAHLSGIAGGSGFVAGFSGGSSHGSGAGTSINGRGAGD